MARPLRLRASVALCAAGLALLAAGALAQGPGEEGGGLAYSIQLDGTIDPATERWIDKALGEAADRDAKLAIIRMDTPGGLAESMREIILDVIDAPMPVVVYVSPNGARAASAGLFIEMSADVAAMVPQSNIGSASPVSVGGGDIDETLGRKIENDAAAFVRALAEDHDRNGDLAEEMVRDATNVTATEAKQRNLIDVIAGSQEELLTKLDGFEVKGPKAQVLDTDGLVIENRDMPFQFDALQLLVNPTVAFILMAAGLAGLAIEVFNPGLIFPGTFGGISLILGLFGTAQLPVTAAGIILLLLSLGLFVAETQVPSGILGAAGVVALGAGGLLLFDTNSEAFEINTVVVLFTAALLGGFTLLVINKVIATRHQPVRTGWEEMVGKTGEVRVALDPLGQVFADGALWRAKLVAEDAPLERGYRVRVESVEGLTLRVAPVDEEQPEGAE